MPNIITERPIKVRPQRVAARRQGDIVCAMAFQELEWHDICDVYFEVDQDEIPEVVIQSETPLINKVDPIWTSDY